jgi:hypothetical protein
MWPGEVRYALSGRFDAAHVAGVRETIEAVRAATGLRVEDVTRDDRDPNLLFIFANNVDATVGDLALAARLIGPGETFVEYFARLRATLGRAGIFSSRRFEGGDIVSVAVVVNARLDNGVGRANGGRGLHG